MKSYVINTVSVPALCFRYCDVVVYVQLMYSLDGQRYINAFHNVPEYFPKSPQNAPLTVLYKWKACSVEWKPTQCRSPFVESTGAH